MRARGILAVTAAVVAAVVVGSTLGPKRQTDLPVVGPPIESQTFVTLASNGSEVLLVWNDQRHLASGKLYGELQSASGRPSPSSTNLAIRVGLFTDAENPAAAHNGTRYLVVWDEDGPNGTKEIFGAFIASDRTVGAAFQITNLTGDQLDPGVTANPSTGQFLVTWVDRRASPNRLYAKRLDASGADVDAAGGFLVSTLAVPSSPRASFDGTYYVLAWQDLRANPAQVYASRILPSNGAVQDGTGDVLDPTAFSQSAPGLASGAGVSLVAWAESRDGGAGDLYGKRYQAGAPTGLTSLLGQTAAEQSDPFVTFDGARFWIAYQDTSATFPEVRLARLDTDGTQRAGARVPTDGGQYFAPAIGGANGVMGVFFHGGGGDPYETDIFHAYLNSGGGTGSIIFNSFPAPQVAIISQGANGQFFATAASDGTQYLVVWSDSRTPHAGLDVYGIRVDLNGVPKDTAAFLIAGGPNDQALPSVAYGDGVFLVTYPDGEVEGSRFDLGAVRVSRDGVVLDNPKRFIHDTNVSGLRRGAVSFNGSNFLVAFAPASGELSVLRVQSDGGVLDPTGLPILTTGGSGPRLAFDGTNHLMTFYRGDPIFSSSSIHAARIRPDGGIIETDGFNLSVGPSRRTPSGLDFDGRRYVVAWTEERSSTQSEVVVSYVTPEGTSTSPVVVAPDPTAFRHAANVVYDGRKPLVSWIELKPAQQRADLLGAWLEDGGSASAAPLTFGQDVFYFPLFLATSIGASARTGNSLLLEERIVIGPSDNANRVLMQTLDEREGLGADCTANSQCGSGFCVDGVCCDSACGGGGADCQACSAAGVCTPTAAQTECRGSLGVCDPAEVCNGVEGTCPADAKLPAGSVCNAAVGACDLAETCDGAGNSCPADQIAPPNYECRPAQGGCDVAETCNGTSTICPVDERAEANTVCRAAVSSCDVEESCSGASKDCPSDGFAPDETTCSENGLCQGGACESPRSYYGWGCGGCSGASGAPLALAALLIGALRRRRGRGRAGAGGLLLGALLLIAATPSAARAAEEDELSKLLVIGITPRAGVSPEQSETVASFVQTELVSFNAYRVSGASEVAAVIGLERQKQLLGCSSEAEAESCMAEVAGAMNADRVLSGDLGILGDQLLLNLTLVDARTAKPISRTAVRAPASGSIDAVLDNVKPALYELVLKDTARKSPTRVSYQKAFGGVVVGLRGEMDVARVSPTPAVQVELSTRRFGAAVTALVQPNFGVRAEGRFYPVELGALRPYLGLGATAFIPAVGGRVVAGAAYRFSSLQLSLDFAYEHFFNPAPGFFGNAVVAGLGVGWQL